MAPASVTQNPSGAYVYQIVVDGVVRYIGKGTGRRHKVHLQVAARINRRRARCEKVKALRFHNRLARALRCGLTIEVFIVASGLEHEAAFAAEMAAIASAPHGQLWNETQGGEGMHPDYARAMWDDPAYREKRRAQHARPEFREKQRQNAIRQHESAEARRALSDRSKAMWSDEDFRAKAEARLKGIWSDSELRARHKIGVQNFREQNPETVASVTETLNAYNRKPEVRERRSQFFKAAWQDEHFRAKATAHWNDPERKKSVVAGLTPEFLKERGKAISEGLQRSAKFKASSHDPKKFARVAEANKAHWQSPEARSTQSAKMKALWADPEYRAKTTAHWAVKRKARNGG